MISLGLTGFPLDHSLSPRIHETALSYCALKGKYLLYPVSPDDERALENLLGRVRAGKITGLNVTIPYKQRVMPFLDVLTPAATAIGAVNTIYLKDDQLTGDNTDAAGFLDDLKSLIGVEKTEKILGGKALVLGAGGAARAVVYALLNDGWEVTLAARREEQAQELLSQFPTFQENLHAIAFSADAIQNHTHEIKLVVNATPLGMSPKTGENPWPQDVPMPETALCYDLVYNPRETCFVRQARDAGLRANSGLGMLVRQAALAFEIWTGQNVPVDHLIPAVEVA